MYGKCIRARAFLHSTISEAKGPSIPNEIRHYRVPLRMPFFAAISFLSGLK